MISIFRLHIPWPIALLATADLAALALSAYLGISLRSSLAISSLSMQQGSLLDFFNLSSYKIAQIAVFTEVSLLSLFMLGAYRRPALIRLRDAVPPILLAHVLAFAMLTVLFYVVQDTRIFLLALLPALLVSLLLITLNHYIFKRHVAYQRIRRRVIVLGTGPAAANIERIMAAGRTPMVDILGFIPIENIPPTVQEDKIIHCTSSLSDFAKTNAIDEIVVALEERRKNLPISDLLACRLNGTLVTNLPTFFEREESRIKLETLHPSWMIFSHGFSAGKRIQRYIKRVFDIVASTIVIFIGSPILLVAALAILIEDSWPILYRQTRVGLSGRQFALIKLRTMRRDSEADGVAQWSKAGDLRVTRVGKTLRRTRIDEIPQVWNVLRGEMSFIGPRPERPEFVETLNHEIVYYSYRHTVKPGVSGWAQINYPYGASVKDAKRKLEYDLYYIKNYSLFLDIIVLLQTIRVVLQPETARSQPTPLGRATRDSAAAIHHADDSI